MLLFITHRRWSIQNWHIWLELSLTVAEQKIIYEKKFSLTHSQNTSFESDALNAWLEGVRLSKDAKKDSNQWVTSSLKAKISSLQFVISFNFEVGHNSEPKKPTNPRDSKNPRNENKFHTGWGVPLFNLTMISWK